MSCTWLIWAEMDGNRVRRAALELLGRARGLGHEAVAVVVGADPAAVAPYAAAVVASPEADVVDVLAGLAAQRSPAVIGAGATVRGREVMGRLAARLGAPLAADCTSVDDGEVVRPVHGGKILARYRLPDGLALLTLRPNSLPVPAAGPPGSVERIDTTPGAARVERLELVHTVAGALDLQEAEVVVAAGRGIGNPEDFFLAEDLARELGAAVGASRAVVDAGWRSHHDQVGKSGKTVSPRLYVALGISGAIHHVMGMDSSGVVVAVNSDPSAPIFAHADYGIVGDIRLVVPALIAALRAR